jgi:hypothetical protein
MLPDGWRESGEDASLRYDQAMQPAHYLLRVSAVPMVLQLAALSGTMGALSVRVLGSG